MRAGAFTPGEKAEIELDKRLSEAFIGYARFDVVTHRKDMTFKRWNDRPLLTSQLNGLITSFKVDGVNRFKASNAIPLVVPKKYIVPDTYGSDGNAMENLREMQLTVEAFKAISAGQAVVYVASGQHRIMALDNFQMYLLKIKAESVKTRQRLEKQLLDDVDQMDIDEENKREKPKRDQIDGSLAFKGQWMVAIYDYGEQAFYTPRPWIYADRCIPYSRVSQPHLV